MSTRAGLAALLVSGIALVGCSSGGAAGAAGAGAAGDDCAFLLSEAREHVSGLTSYEALEAPLEDGADWVIAELKSDCPAEFSQVRSEVADKARNLVGGADPWDDPGASGARGGLRWNQADDHVGERRTVCGPLVNDGRSGDDVFLNLGRGYPDRERFTVVLWDVGGIEEIPSGTKVCASGTISLYQGVAQIQAQLEDVSADLP